MTRSTPPLLRVQQRMATVDTGDPDACHEWPGTRTKGYGVVTLGRKRMYVSRVLLEWSLGRPIRPGMKALHTCDNPPCCNLRHLYEGTQRQNIVDAISRGRLVSEGNPGVRHPMARLTEGQVRAIRCDARSAGLVAADYGVSRSAVSLIRLRKRWAHVPD